MQVKNGQSVKPTEYTGYFRKMPGLKIIIPSSGKIGLN
jgi:pyruvate/2-oxoglutarate/acetoin dehydrogenase E1 component